MKQGMVKNFFLQELPGRGIGKGIFLELET
jgi:hypothetical protein